VALDLALRHPGRVRARVLLEPDAPRELAPAATAWIDALADRLRQVAAEQGVGAVSETLVSEVAGSDAWRALPDDLRSVLAGNGPAMLAELAGEWWLDADAAALSAIERPALVVKAADSPPEFHKAADALVDAIPGARVTVVEGGHLIDPAGPPVLAFIAEVLGRRATRPLGRRRQAHRPRPRPCPRAVPRWQWPRLRADHGAARAPATAASGVRQAFGTAAMKRAALDAVELEYGLRGSGEPGVLQHWGTCAAWARELLAAPALRDRYRLLSYSRVGRLTGTAQRRPARSA
jgi:hypothetical protein